MTEQQRTEELYKIGKLVKKLFPDFYGYIQFTLTAEKDNVIVRRHEVLIEKEKK